MKVIREPKVYLVSRPCMDVRLVDFLRDDLGTKWNPGEECADAEILPEVAGRLCYLSFDNPRPGGNKAYLHHILEAGHGSVLEHSTFGFIFTGISRSCSHELVRHRHFAFSQLSQRYVDESEAGMVLPNEVGEDESLTECWQEAVSDSSWQYGFIYQGLRNNKDTASVKAARGAARSVMPNATETKIMMTGNCRAWRGLLEQRASRHADAEIRKVANKVYEVLVQEAVNIFGDYTKVELPDGTFELTTPYRKV